MPAENPKQSGLLIPLVLGFTAVILFQGYHLLRLQRENEGLRQANVALNGIQKKNLAAASGSFSPDELESLRQSKSELQRLRGQFAVLRQQLQDGPEKKNEKPVSPPDAAKEETAPPVRTYTTTTHAQLKPDEIMVTGGWATHAGSSVWIILTPSISGPDSTTPNVINIEQKILEVPDQAARNLGLAELRTNQTETTQNGILAGPQAEAFWQQLEASEGVALLSSPKVSTVSGRQAQISALEAVIIDEKTFNLGSTVDILPTILDNGLLKLTVVGRVTLRTGKGR